MAPMDRALSPADRCVENAADSRDEASPSLEQAFRQYAPFLARLGTKLLGTQEVEDLVQDVFLDAQRGLRGLRDPAAVRAWLATVTVRKARRRLRYRRFKNLVALHEEAGAWEVSREASPEQRALLASVCRRLDQLPPRIRIPWTLRYLEEMSLKEIADVCECSLATVKRRISAAHQELGEIDHA